MERMELLLHPVRMRIMLTAANRVLTPQQLADLLPDVAQTTLYRHINLLLEGGVLEVVRESKVRGTVERAVTLVEDAGRIDLATSAALSPEEHERIFTTIFAALLAEFKRAQAQPQPGMPPAIYTQHRLYLTAEELHQLTRDQEALLAPYQDPARQGAGVQPWLLTTMALSNPDLSPTHEEHNP